MVIKNRHEVLDQKVWETSISGTLRKIWTRLLLVEKITVLGPDYSLTAAFFHLLGSKDNTGAVMVMILTEDPIFTHLERFQVPLDLF